MASSKKTDPWAWLGPFIEESWIIEGAQKDLYGTRRDSIFTLHRDLIGQPELSVDDLEDFAEVATSGRGDLRERAGMDVRVGNHFPPPGGPSIRPSLQALLDKLPLTVHPHEAHVQFEDLHPFMDGNGRTGRLLWAWHMEQLEIDPHWKVRGFLHTFYYQTLETSR